MFNSIIEMLEEVNGTLFECFEDSNYFKEFGTYPMVTLETDGGSFNISFQGAYLFSSECLEDGGDDIEEFEEVLLAKLNKVFSMFHSSKRIHKHDGVYELVGNA